MEQVVPHIGKDITITTDHAMSSYGQPVAVIDGVAYGPGDMLVEWGKWSRKDPQPVWVIVNSAHTSYHTQSATAGSPCNLYGCQHVSAEEGQWRHTDGCNLVHQFVRLGFDLA